MRCMKPSLNRRDLLRGGALLTASSLLPLAARAAMDDPSAAPSPIRLGIASYTFRNFDQAHLIEFMKQLKTPYLNLKDMHLPMTPLDQVKVRAAEYRAAVLFSPRRETSPSPKMMMLTSDRSSSTARLRVFPSWSALRLAKCCRGWRSS